MACGWMCWTRCWQLSAATCSTRASATGESMEGGAGILPSALLLLLEASCRSAGFVQLAETRRVQFCVASLADLCRCRLSLPCCPCDSSSLVVSGSGDWRFMDLVPAEAGKLQVCAMGRA